jgi:hypothetical protein
LYRILIREKPQEPAGLGTKPQMRKKWPMTADLEIKTSQTH